MAKFPLEKWVYVDCPPLITLPTNIIAEKYNKLLRRAYETFRIVRFIECTLMVDENNFPNINLIDQGSPE